MNAHVGALRLVASTLAEGIRPKPRPLFRDWLPKNIVLVDGPKKGEFWSPEDAPYLPAIADCLSLEDPSNLVTCRKCQQSGVSILALAWTLYLAEHAPDNVLYGVPGIEALSDMSGQKLQPLIDDWHKATGKSIIAPVTSRSGIGSTIHDKKFPGGFIKLANANTVMDLSQKTIRYGVKDEASKWQMLPNGADPENLFFGRFTAFRRQKTYKIFELSTPELDSGDPMGEGPGHCRIDRSFKRSDQRFWNIRCPECEYEFTQTWDGFQIDREQPHKSVYVCPDCGHWISELERVPLVRAGRFVATQTGPDRHPGFHVDAFISLMMSYEAIAEDFLKTEGKGEAGAKDFHNLVQALPYAMRGNAPDEKLLMGRREDYPEDVVPADGLIFVGGADVGHHEIYVELVAFAQDRQSWTVHAEVLAGETIDANQGAWVLLDELYQRVFADAYGNDRRIEALAVDAGDGNRTTQVYEWCRRRPNTYAVKGVKGRGAPAIDLPQKRSISRRGKRQKYNGARTWPVGTWSLKGELYGNLHKDGLSAGEPTDPTGYCHFPKWLGEEFFLQLTAEYFHQEMVRGRYVEEWRKSRKDNHFLDCRIYAMAMAEHMGLSKLTPDGWAQLRAQYADGQPDLLSAEPQKIAAAVPAKANNAASSGPSLSDISASLNS